MAVILDESNTIRKFYEKRKTKKYFYRDSSTVVSVNRPY